VVSAKWRYSGPRQMESAILPSVEFRDGRKLIKKIYETI
jgi:hypothetical protein